MDGAAIKDGIAKDHMNKDHTEGMRARSLHFGEPIAARLGVDYPFPPHLDFCGDNCIWLHIHSNLVKTFSRYAYPPPDGNILTNIVNALIAVPRFYTQVLHLMNKMNIPAPFRLPLPTPPLPPSIPAPPSPSLTLPPLPPPVTPRPQVTNMSSDESEMESSEEDVEGKYNSSGVSKTAKSGNKRSRCETIVGPGIDKDVAHEAVGVKPSTLVPKEIPMIKKKNPVFQIRIAPKVVPDRKDDNINNELEEPEKEAIDLKPYATLEDLERGKLPPEEILSLPMFKNYTAGSPTSVLYIKNLAKDVVNDDFFYIFGSIFGGIDEAKSALTVKLMQEGRMRGQAFVTFPSVELAQHALNLVNGYVFKGKPMIIQFGRNPGAAKGS